MDNTGKLPTMVIIVPHGFQYVDCNIFGDIVESEWNLFSVKRTYLSGRIYFSANTVLMVTRVSGYGDEVLRSTSEDRFDF